MGIFQHHVSFQGCISYVFLFELILLPGRSALGIFGPLDVLSDWDRAMWVWDGFSSSSKGEWKLEGQFLLTTFLGCFEIFTGDVSWFDSSKNNTFGEIYRW